LNESMAYDWKTENFLNLKEKKKKYD